MRMWIVKRTVVTYERLPGILRSTQVCNGDCIGNREVIKLFSTLVPDNIHIPSNLREPIAPVGRSNAAEEYRTHGNGAACITGSIACSEETFRRNFGSGSPCCNGRCQQLRGNIFIRVTPIRTFCNYFEGLLL